MRDMLRRWRNSEATACLVVAVTLATVFAGTSAQASGIMLQIKDVPLKEVVSLLMQQSGANVVIQDASSLERKVSASLNDVPLEKALNYIVRSAGVSYKKMDDGTYIIGGNDLEESVLPKEILAAALPPVAPTVTSVQPRTIIIPVKLVHSKASDLLRLLGWDGVNPMKNCEAVYPAFTGVDNTPPSGNGGLFLHSNTGQTINASQGIKMQNGQPIISTIDPASLSPGAGRTADSFTGAGQFPEGATTRPYNVPGQPPRSPTTTTSTSAATTTSSASSNFLMPEGIVDVKPFDLDNSIIVKGTEEAIEEFKKIIRMLDVPPQQVQVKAEFVEVKTTDVKAFGIDWSLQRLNESFATAFGPTGNVVVGFATGNLTASLRTQLTNDVGTIINSPIISTINNQNAQISISTIIPYWTSMATVVGDNNIINQAYPNFIDINTHLDILPRVNGDGTITMILRPGVADTGNVVTGPDGTVIPEQRTQELFTQRRVANGETIVVGGFIRKNDSQSFQKIPVLGDLPIVGSLFRTVNKTTEDRELLIFITPTIIPPTGGGSVGDVLLP